MGCWLQSFFFFFLFHFLNKRPVLFGHHTAATAAFCVCFEDKTKNNKYNVDNVLNKKNYDITIKCWWMFSVVQVLVNLGAVS